MKTKIILIVFLALSLYYNKQKDKTIDNLIEENKELQDSVMKLSFKPILEHSEIKEYYYD